MSKSQTFTAGCSAVGGFSYAGNFTLYVVLTDRDGNAGTNVSQVDYNVYCQSNGSGSISAKHLKYFSINGSEKINATSTVNVSSPYAYISIASGTISVTHNNDGTATIPFSAQIKASSYGVSASVSGNFTLETIPRYFSSTPSLSATSKTLNTITLKWSTSETCDKVDYNVNGTNKGEVWTGSATSGSFTISSLSPNSTYKIYVWCRRKDSQLGSTSSTISVTTYDIARLTETPNVNIGSSHTIKWTNPGGATTSLKLCKTDGTQVISYGTVTGTSKSVTPTASTLYALTPSSNTLTLQYILTTTQNGSSYTNAKNCVFSVTNSNPTFSNFTYQDTNSATLALTGNNQIIVKGYSNVKGIVSVANKATAKNSASMSKYRLSIGDKTAEVAYSSSAEVSATINAVQSNSFTMYAVDSRQNSTGKTILASTYKDYSAIAITSITVVRTNSVTSETTLKFSGKFWNGNFGSVTNSIKTCSYRYRLSTSSSWTNGATTITPTTSGGTFSFSGKIQGDLEASGFNIDNSYIIQVFISDELSNNNSNPAQFTLGPGTPAMAIYKNNVAIGQRYDTSDGSKLQVNGKSTFKDVSSMTKSSGDTGYYAKRSDTGVEVWMGVGAGGTNHGVFSKVLNKWLLYTDGTDAYIPTIKEMMFPNRSNIVKTSNNWITSGADGADTTSSNLTLHSWFGIGFRPTVSGQTVPQGKNAFWFNVRNGNMSAPYGLISSKEGTLQAKPTSLYDNSSGTTGNVTLSQSAANFTYLEIFYFDGTDFGNGYHSVKVYSPNGKIASLFSLIPASTSSMLLRYNAKPVKISGTSISAVGTYYDAGWFYAEGASWWNTNEMKIAKVIGYK